MGACLACYRQFQSANPKHVNAAAEPLQVVMAPPPYPLRFVIRLIEAIHTPRFVFESEIQNP